MTIDLKSKICAVTVPYPGTSEWLRHGKEEGLWDLVVLGDGETNIPDGAELYLFGAWHNDYMKFIEQVLRPAGKKIAIAWSSSSTEMDEAMIEIVYALGLIKPPQSEKIDAWGCLDRSLVPHFPNAVHLPAAIHLPAAVDVPVEKRTGIGFYAPATQKKNIHTQLLAVRAFQKEDPKDDSRILFTNIDKYKPVLDGYGIRYELEPWVADRTTHLERLSRRKVVLSASHAESWCYGAVDALSMGTPVIGSPTIPWLPWMWRVNNPNDPEEVRRGLAAFWNGTTKMDIHQEARRFIEDVAVRQNLEARAGAEALLAAAMESKVPEIVFAEQKTI